MASVENCSRSHIVERTLALLPKVTTCQPCKASGAIEGESNGILFKDGSIFFERSMKHKALVS